MGTAQLSGIITALTQNIMNMELSVPEHVQRFFNISRTHHRDPNLTGNNNTSICRQIDGKFKSNPFQNEKCWNDS
jgi:hypothetical protein